MIAKMDDSLLRIFVENVPTLCWMADPQGNIFWFNKRWHAYCGTTDAQMANGGWRAVHKPEILSDIMVEWQKAFEAKSSLELTMPLKAADGSFRTFLTQIEPACDNNGEILGWVGVHTDISAQQRTEAKLHNANSRLEAVGSYRDAILGQLVEGVIITDPNGKISFVNEAANTLHGVSKLDVEPEEYASTYSLFTEEGEPHPMETLPLARAVLNDETVIRARWRIRKPDGTEVLAIGNAQPVYATNGEKIGAVLTIHDDTERYAMEQDLADAVKIKEALLYEVNHRVKNSLQIVTSLLQLQARKSESAELRQALSEARLRVDIVANLHRHLYSEGEHTSVELGSYLRQFADETIGAFSSAGSIKHNFTVEREISLNMDKAVPVALIVGELLTNAIKYAFVADGDNRIDLNVAAGDGQIRLSVADNGVGLKAGFDPMSSGGFGMTIVGALLQQLSGEFRVMPREKGAAFEISFPEPV
ncbi:MAG: PAS domain S-box protein [Sphingomonadaceae bacterium]|nr:PAS domain S-box protein [Sphingomonadaceae bacterium]